MKRAVEKNHFQTAFYVGVFSSFIKPSYWLLRNKQPIEIVAQISPPSRPIGRIQTKSKKTVLFVPEKILIYHRYFPGPLSK